MSLSEEETAYSLSNEVLQLILMPTEACNLRCTYCYEDFRHGRMKPSVVRGIKRLLTRRASGLRLLDLSWFGGEPLLARDIMEEILLHARTLLRKHPAIRFSSSISTNAVLLTPAVAERILELGVVRYQVSLDGPREWHDRKRVFPGRGATFDRIWGNLMAMRNLLGSFSVLVRLHLDRENLASLPGFIEDYSRTFGKDPRFRLFLRPLARLGSPSDAALPTFGQAEGERATRELGACVEKHGLKYTTMDMEDDDICYAARANSFVVRADGRLNKCTVVLEDPANQVGRIHEDGHVRILPEKMGPWLRGHWSGKPGEVKCPKLSLADPAARSPSCAPTSRSQNAGA